MRGTTYRYQVFFPDGWTAKCRRPIALFLPLQAAHDEVRYTEFAGVNHGSWVPAYALPQLWP